MRICIIVLLIIPHMASGGFERTQVGARPAGLGNAYVAMGDDPWVIVWNPACLTQISSSAISIFYSPTPFGIPELSTTAVAVLFPTSLGTLGGVLRRYGFELYREITATVSYAHTLRTVSLGVNINYHSVSIKGYGMAATIGFDAGLLIPFSDELRWGVSMKNINTPSIGEAKEQLPQILTSGIAYLPTKFLTLELDVQKESRTDLSPHVGFEYWFVESFALRGGASDIPSEISGGISIRFSPLQFDYAFVSHHELGGTHQVSITFSMR